MAQKKTFGERLASVETSVEYIKDGQDRVISMLKDHIRTPNCDTCKLNDNFIKLDTNVKWIKRIGYFVTTIILAVFNKDLIIKMFNRIF